MMQDNHDAEAQKTAELKIYCVKKSTGLKYTGPWTCINLDMHKLDK